MNPAVWLTWQRAEEGLLLRVTAHMRFQCVSARMVRPLARTIPPLTRIPRTLGADVLDLHVLDQVVAVAQVTYGTSFPLACRDLVRAQCVFVVRGRAGCAAFGVF